MLARFLFSVCVFAAGGLAQSPSPTYGLYQFLTNDQDLRLREVSLEAIRADEPPRFQAPKPAASVISAERLAHTPSRKAVRANARVAELAKKGRLHEASTWFQATLAIDPQYPEALMNLGVAQMRSGDPEGGLETLRKAVAADPHNAMALCNLAGAYGALSDLRAAEQAARRALALDPSMTKARYFLGLALAGQPGHADEALRQLRVVEDEYPEAHRIVASGGAMAR